MVSDTSIPSSQWLSSQYQYLHRISAASAIIGMGRWRGEEIRQDNHDNKKNYLHKITPRLYK